MEIFVSVAKKVVEEEKYELQKTNFEGAYLKDSLTYLAQIWNERFAIPRDVSQKKLVTSV